MKSVKQRPFAFSCIIFTAFLFVSFFLGLIYKIIIGLLCLIAYFILFKHKEKYKFALIYLFPPLIISCIMSSIYFSINYQNILTYANHEIQSEFVIIEENKVSDDYSSYTIQLSKIGNNKVHFKAKFNYNGRIDSPLFKKYTAKLKFSDIKASKYNASVVYSSLAKGIYLDASSQIIEYENETVKIFPTYYLKNINSFLSDIFDSKIEGEENNLTQALILGNKSKLDKNTIYNFRSLGLSHMLAVSGMHLSILIGSIEKLVEKLRLKKHKRYILMILITIVYAGITGFSPSVKRAALMLIVYYLSFLFSKNSDSITSLCLALAIICFISPDSVFDIGLWLSFLSTYGILEVAVPLNEKYSEKAYYSTSVLYKSWIKLVSMLLYGIVPVMFSIFVIWLSYGEIAILSPVMNILFTPLLLCIMYISPLVLIFSFIPYVSTAISFCAKSVSGLMLFLTKTFSDYSPIVNIDYEFTFYIAVFFALSVLVLALLNINKKVLYFVPFVISVLIFSICSHVYTNSTFDTQKLIYSNNYYGDQFLVISKNKGLLCDISGNSEKCAYFADYYLYKNHLTYLDSFVITEYNDKAPQTLKELTSVTKIKKLYLPSAYGISDNLLKTELISAADENNITIIEYPLNNDDQIDFFGLTLNIKNVRHSSYNSQSSFCISFSNGNTSYHYLSNSSYSTPEGYSYITNLLDKNEKLIFGSYGKSVNVDYLPIVDYKEKMYFASENVYSLYSNAVKECSETTIITDDTEFYLTSIK